MQFNEFMVDIETLGKGPRAAVIQIGICGFSLKTGEVDSPQTYHVDPHPECEIDPDTVRWWMMQSQAAREAVFGQVVTLAPRVALSKLKDYVLISAGQRQDPPTFWAMPPSFDLVILENLCRLENVAPPWAYNATRCLRTLCDLADVQKQERVKARIEHDAGCDAEAQAATAVFAFQSLRNKMFAQP